MIDITQVGTDGLEVFDTLAPRAANLLGTQLAYLEYEPTFGIDLRYFLQDGIKFQNDSFKAYLVEQLANRGINLASLDVTIENLFATYNFNLAPEDKSGGLVAR